MIRGRVQDVTGQPFLQLDSKEVANGMSGAPVVHAASQQVVGMISSSSAFHGSTKLRDLALAIPAEIVQEFLLSQQPLQRENLFYVSGRITDPAHFSGREREIRKIRTELRKWNSVSIVGPSGIGKSSLLYYLYQTAPDWFPNTRTVFLDLQSVLDEADFCAEILRALGKEGHTLRQLKRALQVGNLLLLLDEIEKLTDSNFSTRLHDLLRSLAQEPHVAICVTSQRPLAEVFPNRAVSSLHNVFVEVTLEPFGNAEAQTLLTQRMADLQQNIQRSLDLLSLYESLVQLEDDPRKLMRYWREIDREKETIERYTKEVAALGPLPSQSPEANTLHQSLDTVHQKVDALSQQSTDVGRKLTGGQANIMAHLVQLDRQQQAHYLALTQRLDQNQVELVDLLLDAADKQQITQWEAAQLTLLTQQALVDLHHLRQNQPDSAQWQTISALLAQDATWEQKLKWTIPLILGILELESESRVDVIAALREAWGQVRDRLKK